MLYSVKTISASPEYIVLDILFTEPVFMLLLLLIPAGLIMFRKDMGLAKLIGLASLAMGVTFLFAKILYMLGGF